MNRYITSIIAVVTALLVCGCRGRGASSATEEPKYADKSYSGFGYAGVFPETGSGLRFRLEALAEGDYTLSLRYGVEGTEIATVSLFVDDVKVGPSLSLTPPADGEWGEHSVDIALDEGINHIDFLRGEGDNGKVMIDYIEVYKK